MWPLLFLHLLTPIGIVRSQPGANHGSHHKEPPGKVRSLVDQDLNTDEILKSEDDEELEVDPDFAFSSSAIFWHIKNYTITDNEAK